MAVSNKNVTVKGSTMTRWVGKPANPREQGLSPYQNMIERELYLAPSTLFREDRRTAKIVWLAPSAITTKKMAQQVVRFASLGGTKLKLLPETRSSAKAARKGGTQYPELTPSTTVRHVKKGSTPKIQGQHSA